MSGDSVTSASAPEVEYLELVHGDYRHAVERIEQLGDALQDDFKMLVVVIPLLSAAIAGLSGVTKINGVEFSAGTGATFAFWAFAALITVVAIIGFRDYVRAIGFEHALYVVIRYERHFTRLIRAMVPEGAGAPVTPAQYFVQKFLPRMRRLSAATAVVSSIPTFFAPPIVLTVSGHWRGALAIFVYSGILTTAYVTVGQRVLGRFTEFFKSVSEAALHEDDPEPPTRSR